MGWKEKYHRLRAYSVFLRELLRRAIEHGTVARGAVGSREGFYYVHSPLYVIVMIYERERKSVAEEKGEPLE